MTIEPDDIECLANISEAITRGESIAPDHTYGRYLRNLADRLCPRPFWMDTANASVGTLGDWTFTVCKSYLHGGGHKFAWHAVGPDLDSEATDECDTIAEAKSAAVEWARKHPVK